MPTETCSSRSGPRAGICWALIKIHRILKQLRGSGGVVEASRRKNRLRDCAAQGAGPKGQCEQRQGRVKQAGECRHQQEREANCALLRLPLRGVSRGFVLGWRAAGALEWRFWPWWLGDGTAGGVSSLTCWGLCPRPPRSLQEHTGTNIHQVRNMASNKAGTQR